MQNSFGPPIPGPSSVTIIDRYLLLQEAAEINSELRECDLIRVMARPFTMIIPDAATQMPTHKVNGQVVGLTLGKEIVRESVELEGHFEDRAEDLTPEVIDQFLKRNGITGKVEFV